MTSHLLSLSTLHAAAPGVLDVVFGPDGDFKGAPAWDPPVLWLNQYIRWGWLRSQASFEHLILPDLALDLRIPSVAARLAGMCARALDPSATGAAWVAAAGEIHPDHWVLRYCDDAGYAAVVAWNRSTGAVDRRGLSPAPPNTPAVSGGLADPASFLAFLTLALAPRIAALGGSHA